MSAHKHAYFVTEAEARTTLVRAAPTAEMHGLRELAMRRLVPVTTEDERRAVREYNAARGYVCVPYDPPKTEESA